MNKFVCSICGKTHYDLTEYVDCVTKCSEKIKKEQKEAEEKKRLEEVNAAINRVKQAESYFKQQLDEFKEKYPEEYKFNFEDVKEEKDCGCDDKKTCGGTCGGCKDTNTCNDCDNDWLNDFLNDDETKKSDFLKITYKNDGNGKPEFSASINGKKVSDDALEKLFEDPDARYLAKLIEIL